MTKSPARRLLIVLAILIVAVVVIRWFGGSLMHALMVMHGRQ